MGIVPGLRKVLRPGDILGGRFEIQAELGRGTMGIVYRAFQLPQGPTVAIKLLEQQLQNDPEALARFQREVQIGNRISHPNVVQVLGSDVTEWGAPYLVEEFLEGKDLQTRLQAGETLSLRDVTYLMVALCDALEAAHAQGIVHRDIKPGNVFLGRSQRGELQVKLIDFGLAKMMSNAPGLLTAQVSAIGTPAYMSPEQIQNKPLDGRADIYSMGVMLYQLLTGTLPFWADDPLDVAAKILKGKPEDLRRRGRGRSVPAGLAKLTMQAISREPNARPKNVKELRERLLRARQELVGGHGAPGFFRRLLTAMRLVS